MKKVIVAMSGGVDSSVAAAILKKQAPMLPRRKVGVPTELSEQSGSRSNVGSYEVMGIFLNFWKEENNGAENRCCSLEAQEAARRVAQHLKIPLYTLNYEKQFKKAVVDYFITEYTAGRTPNPCVMCNKFIKFGLLLEEAKKQGADFLATGHYCRLRRKSEILNSKSEINLKFQNPNSKTSNGFASHQLVLCQAKDKLKDQSYFLWTLAPKQLKQILFPIGDYTKKQVRALARKWGLPTAERRESQEICFVSDGLREFLHRHIKKAKPGPFLNSRGQKVGEHLGLSFYTIGQRKELPNLLDQTPASPPRYIIEKDFNNNAIIIGEESNLYHKELIAEQINWLNNDIVKSEKQFNRVQARIRYGQPVEACQIKHFGTKSVKVIFDKPQWAVTPGQSIVFYRGKEVLGGGIIRS